VHKSINILSIASRYTEYTRSYVLFASGR